MKWINSALGMSLLTILLVSNPANSAPHKTGSSHANAALNFDTDTRLDCNNLEMFVYNDCNFAYDKDNVLGKTDGLYFPRGTKKTVVYSAGLWIGALVNGEVRLAIAEYSSEFVPGPMLSGTYQPDNTSFRVYKIATYDTPESNPDYANWPTVQGAPVDENGDPLLIGNQTTWSVCNDANPAAHILDAAATAPLGLEIQQTSFGFARSGARGNTYFIKYKLINKGSNHLEDAYVSIWADTDLGNAGDDLVGCDTVLSLGYCYNDGDDTQYGANPPAVGFDLLQGPIVPSMDDSAFVDGSWRHGYRNLSMTSFIKYINGTDPANKVETYGYMRGLVKDPNNGTMVPMINPVTSSVTSFAVPGDPVANDGWVDQTPADRRLMINSGPFDMAPGDTQQIVVAVFVAVGSNPLNSITALRSSGSTIQAMFDHNFTFPTDYNCGDVDQNMQVDITDVVFLINYVFAGGPAPQDNADANVDCSSIVNVTDCVYMINYIFAGGPAPCEFCP